jgi:hypothetical protein
MLLAGACFCGLRFALMVRRSTHGLALRSVFLLSLCLLTVPSANSQTKNSTPGKTADPTHYKSPVYPRGLKLMLADGTYQLAREYERNGDHVRYFSSERGAWEEIPASMVDWTATAKAEAEAEKESTALVEKVHKQEEGRRMDNVTDIDASLQVGEGVFLPQGEGMFVVEGKSIRIVDQVGAAAKTDKMREVADVLSPVHMVPGKQTIEIQGTRAVLRLKTNSPEFYLREAPTDPEHTTAIEQTGRPNESGPDVELIRVKVTHNRRVLESVRTLFGQPVSQNINEVAIQRWEVAPNVYRFTLGQSLPPGEYVLAEMLQDGLNLFVWEFGLDEAAGTSK